MRILHLCLACFYVDGYNYQENVLPRVQKQLGCDVEIIASTETYVDNINIGYIEPQTYVSEDGIKVVRLPYKKSIIKKIERKRRSYIGLYGEIERFDPDIIFAHGMQFKDLDVVTEYKKAHPEIVIYADSHEDIYNSAKTFLSREFLYKRYYNQIIARNISSIKKVLCLSKETMDFMENVCNVPQNKLSFFPLGGEILTDEEYNKTRKLFRSKLGVNDDEIVLMFSGKIGEGKKVKELVNAFYKVKASNVKLVLIGSIGADEEKDYLDLFNRDSRIDYVGWKSSKELLSYLCACDLYCQPGSQSATMQNAACNRCALLLYPYDSHLYLWGENAAFYAKSEQDIYNIFEMVINNNSILENTRNNCFAIASKTLDYKKMGEKVIAIAY